MILRSDNTKKEDEELYFHLQELFDIAWDLNNHKQTPTDLSTKILVYFPSIMQQFSYLCDAVEGKEEMRRVAWEEGFNQGYLKGIMAVVKDEAGLDDEEEE